MIRSTLSRKPQPPRRDRSDEFASVVIAPARARMAVAGDLVRAPAKVPALLVKTPDRKQQSIRDSARGEECLVRIPGVCSGDPTHTIWSHAPLGAAGKGRGIKALDLCGAFACVECDQAIDGQQKLPAGYTRQQALQDWFFGHLRSLVRLRQKGLI